MKKLQTFFHVFINSFNPSYYNKLIKTKFSFSLKYFVFLNFLFALLLTAIFTIPIFRIKHQEVFAEIKNIYPQGLIVTYDENGVNINQELPYRIETPEFFENEDPDLRINKVNNMAFVTFDSDKNVDSISDFYRMDTTILITETTLYMLDDGELRIREIPAKMDGELILDKAAINQFFYKVENHTFFRYRLYIPALMVIILTFLFSISLMGWTMTALIYAVLSFVIAKIFIKEKQIGFKKTYQFVLHAITPMLILKFIIDQANLTFIAPWMTFLAIIAWILYIISQIQVETSTAQI
jgi:hypothetical protein